MNLTLKTIPSLGKPSKKRKLRLIIIVFAVTPWLIVTGVLVYNYYEAGLDSLQISYSTYRLSNIGLHNSSQGSILLVINMSITNSGYGEVTIYGWNFFAVKASDLWFGVNDVTSFLNQAGFKPLPSNDTYLFNGSMLSGALCFQIPSSSTQIYPRYSDEAHEQFKTLNVVWIQK